MKKTRDNTNGFTLIEVMVVIAILAVVTAIAMPEFGKKVRAYRMSSAVRELQSAVQGARMTAIRRGANIGLSLDLDNDLCTTFVDDGANQLVLEGDDTVISTLSMPSGVDLYATDTGGTMILFSSRGLVNSPAVTEIIELQNDDGIYRGVSIRITGNSVIVRSGDGSTWL